MRAFIYDKTFEGLLCAIFDAYTLRIFPDYLLKTDDSIPLPATSSHYVFMDENKHERVAKALQKKLPLSDFNKIIFAWLADENDLAVFRAICAIFDNPVGKINDFSDPILLTISQMAHKVVNEQTHCLGFVRFQKTQTDIYYAPLQPKYDILPLMLEHFTDRFKTQKWCLYDVSRQYGFFYDTQKIHQMHMNKNLLNEKTQLADALLAEDEKIIQQLWKEYICAVSIKERENLALQKRFLPKRFWPYMLEMQ